jgi:hypothetical protein
MKLRWDANLKHHHTFKVGDMVLMFHPITNDRPDEVSNTHKFKPDWRGPYVVTANHHKGNCDVYTIRDEASSREWSVNVNKLQPYIERHFMTTPNDADKNQSLNRERDMETSTPASTGGLISPTGNVAGGNAREGSSPTLSMTPPYPTQETKTRSTSKNTSGNLRHRTGETVQESKRRMIREETVGNDPRPEDIKDYEVEEILQHARTREGIKYLTKFTDFSVDKSQWLKESNFNSKTLIQQYWNTRPETERPRNFRTARGTKAKRAGTQKMRLRARKKN